MMELALIGIVATFLAFRILRMTTGVQAARRLDKKQFLLHVGGIVLLLAYCMLSPLVSIWLKGRMAEDAKISAKAGEAERLRLAGNLPEAAEVASGAVAETERRFGSEDPRMVFLLDTHARCLESQSKFGEAEGVRKRALAIQLKRSGEDSPESATEENNLGVLYFEMGRYDEAEARYKRVLARTERIVGRVPAALPVVLENLGNLCEKTGRPEQAKAYRDRAKAFKPPSR
jgi:tetratricopeptide (TPR) repeat protein